jgi:ArsR family transcriptional regulator
MNTNEVLAALSAIAQESRLAIFRLLVQVGPDGMAASKIAEQLDIAPSSLSFHLKELAHAKLINSRSEGRFIIYSTDVIVMNGLVDFLTENCCNGVPCGPVRTV